MSVKNKSIIMLIILLLIFFSVFFLIRFRENGINNDLYPEKCNLYKNLNQYLGTKKDIFSNSLKIYITSLNHDYKICKSLLKHLIINLSKKSCLSLEDEKVYLNLLKSFCDLQLIKKSISLIKLCSINTNNTGQLGLRIETLYYMSLLNNSYFESKEKYCDLYLSHLNKTLYKYNIDIIKLCGIKYQEKLLSKEEILKGYLFYLNKLPYLSKKNKKRVLFYLLSKNVLNEEWLNNPNYLIFNINIYAVLSELNKERCI